MAKNLPQWLQITDIEQLITHLPSQNKKDFVHLMYLLGLRLAELCLLEKKQVNLGAKLVTIIGKGNRQRLLPLTEQAFLIISRYMSAPGPYLFTNAFGEPFQARRVREWMAEAGKAADVGHVHPHMLRHSKATHLLDDGMSLPRLQRFLGHASEVTTSIYTHTSVEGMRKDLANASSALVRF